MLRLPVCGRGWLAIGVVVVEMVVVGPLELAEGGSRMSKPQWPPQTAATFDLMGSVVESLGPIGKDTPRVGVGVYAGHDGWPKVGLWG